jgi:hypothetical protein
MSRILVGAALISALGASRAWGIPAFARKYGTSCSTCHVAIPKLNSYGDAFRRNGYVLPQGDTALVKEQPVALGAKAWEQLWPKAIFPGEIHGSVPLSLYMHQRVVVQFSEDKTKDTVLFDAPHELELLMGGNLGKRVSFFGEWVFFENEKNAEGLKRLFVQFNDLFSKEGEKHDNALNVKLGRIEPGTMGGYKDASKRLTMEHPITGDLRALEGSGLAGWDHASWRMRDPQSGIELNGIGGHRFEYAVGVLNGEKFTISEGKGGTLNAKDKYARVAYKIGGMGFDGHGVGEGLDATENWRDDSVTLGAYYYSGRSLKPSSAPSPETENVFERIGVDIDWKWRGLNVLAGYVQGEDGLDRTIRDDDVESSAWFVEPSYRFLPWLIGQVRYEDFKVECEAGGFLEDTGACSPDGRGVLKEGRRINPHVLFLIRPNVRFGIEYLYQDLEWFKGVVPASGTDAAKNSKWVKLNFQIVW